MLLSSLTDKEQRSDRSDSAVIPQTDYKKIGKDLE